MQSWERAKPLSRPDVFLETGGGFRVEMCCEGGNQLGFPEPQKQPRQIVFSLTLYLCVVGRFACQVPILSPTRTAIPERFFGRKITIGNFLSRKPEA